ncbi:MAG: DciA family protein [Rhodocyclaceae bacterium]
MTRQLHRYLGAGATLERLQDHARRLIRLQSLFVRLVPPALAPYCSVGNLKGDTLVLLARNGAAAVKLKQLAPSLAARLAEQGEAVSQIQVKVQMQAEPPPPRPASTRSIGEDARRSLDAFAASLPADAPLRLSVERLLARSRPT